MRYILLSFICSFLFAYQDDELTKLWASLSDIHQPSLTDYQQIETYLHQGERPYLDILRQKAYQVDENTRRRLNNILNFKLLGPNQEMPIFEIHHLNPKNETKRRCILLFGSFNGIYPQKVRKVLEELKLCNYSGDVLLRIGGFPNIQNGGLKICHVPYAFKVAFLQEAKHLGYKEVLWIDTCIHPLQDLEKIFSKITKKGYFFTYAGTLEENRPNHLLEAAATLNISSKDYPHITHVHSSVLGLNMENIQALKLLNTWFLDTEKVYPNITWFPEELSLSAAAWKLHLCPDCWFGMTVCGQQEVNELYAVRPSLQFYCEDIR